MQADIASGVARDRRKLAQLFHLERPVARYAASAALFFALLFMRRSAQLLHPQVWDEDGTQILPALLRHGFKSVFTPVNGYLVVVPKLISAAALWISGLHYPFVSTLLAWLFIIFVCLLVSFSPTWLKGGALLGAATLLVPTNPEVFGIPLYTLWWTGLLLFLVVLWRSDSRNLALRLILVLIGGLSSPVILAVMPLFILRTVIWRKRNEAAVAITAAACCLVQAVVLIQSGVHHVPGGSGHISLLQIPPKFIGGYLAGSLIRSTTHILWLATAVFAVLMLASWRLLRCQQKYLWMLGLWLGTALSIAMRVDIAVLNTRWAGPRYFFLPFVLISWFLISVLFEGNERYVRVFAAALLMVSLINLRPVISRPQQDFHWAQQLEECSHADRYQMQISFDGEKTWAVELAGRECHKLQRSGLLGSLPGGR